MKRRPGSRRKPLTGKTGRGEVRIVGGALRRTPLAVVSKMGLRPTPDRVRETLFNWLGNEVVGARCLDLFAGTGALGLEAASRGAHRVLLNDAVPAVLSGTRSLLDRLNLSTDEDARQCAQCVELVGHDAMNLVRQLTNRGEKFDIVFVDPPFGQGWLPRVLPAIANLLKPTGFAYVEAEAPIDVAIEPVSGSTASWEVYRNAQAGQVHYYLLKPITKAKSE